ncbi:MAG: hypothetical protein R3E68_07110 [Burkholderiaceae bacterium]
MHPSSLQHVWRATQIDSRGIAACDTGFARLNTELPGAGWPVGMLTELITRESGSGELRLLVLRCCASSPASARSSSCWPRRSFPMPRPWPASASTSTTWSSSRPAMPPTASGPSNKPSRAPASARCWPGCRNGALRPEHLRRMQLAAQSAGGPVFLFRELDAQFDTSPAPLRLLLLPRANEQLSVQILKRRGPVMAMP